MSEKKRFGSRISSIFGQSSPSDKKSSTSTNTTLNVPSSNSSNIPKSRGLSPLPSPNPKPLNKPPLQNYSSASTVNSSSHYSSGKSINSKSSNSTLRATNNNNSNIPVIPIQTPHNEYHEQMNHAPVTSHHQPPPTQPSYQPYNPHTQYSQTQPTNNIPNISIQTSPASENYKSNPSPNLSSPSYSRSIRSPSPTPSPVSNKLRRKPPSDLDSFDFGGNLKSTNTSQLQSPQSSSRSGIVQNQENQDQDQDLHSEPELHSDTGVTGDIIADLESEIDNFLQFEDSNSNSNSNDAESRYSSKRNTKFYEETDAIQNEFINDLNLNKRNSIRLDDPVTDFDLTRSHQSNQLHQQLQQQVPYPVNSTIASPNDSTTTTPTESIENSPQIIQNYMMDTTNLENINPFETTLQNSNSNYQILDSSSSNKSSDTSITSPTQPKQYFDQSITPSSSNAPAVGSTSARSSYSRTPTTSSRIPSSTFIGQSPPIYYNSQSPNFQQSQQPTPPPPPPHQPQLQHTKTDVSLYSNISSMKNYNPTSGSQRTYHRTSSSMGSIRSSNSYRNVNLATLKKTLSLKPGEGERSNYVLTIRRNAGTAFNESGPSKWKLPVGILPIDKTAMKDNSNGKYKRLAGNSNNSNYRKKTSGVELKHGHLKPRLLAAEIDEGDDYSTSISISKPPTTNASSSSTTLKNVNSGSQSINKSTSRENSLKRTTTDGSLLTGDTQSLASTNTDSTKNHRNSSIKRSDSVASSESSGSISEKITTGYYQHRGYKYGDVDDYEYTDTHPENDDEEDDITEKSDNGTDDLMINNNTNNNVSNTNGYVNGFGSNGFINEAEVDERPKLVLANPDYSSDSD
ncbi:hypothetical protein KGF54_001968 [Candida jiufengensis]|uniref:uncharacterized protein n=1 Tax=Candida jiufengensis TaxID=497108 RepID=UPI0022241098|nr:uncharacterized protein KGF54_001968 [Candida jiufengensis]KAI5954193.1 hypothetical protein KGF54_001968 [Candida jiufengensis]